MSVANGWIPMTALFLIAAAASPPGFARHSFQGKLELRAARYECRNTPLVEAVLDLAYRYQLPTAIHYLDRAALRAPLTVTLTNTTVKQIMEAVVGRAPGYRVRFSDGLVRVYSPVSRDDSSNPLNTIIQTFDITNLPRQEAEARLLGALVQTASPGAGFGGDAAYGPESGVVLTLHLKRVKVFEILDAIVASDGSSVWVALPPPRNANPPRQSPPWLVFDLRPPTERAVLERLDQLLRGDR